MAKLEIHGAQHDSKSYFKISIFSLEVDFARRIGSGVFQGQDKFVK